MLPIVEHGILSALDLIFNKNLHADKALALVFKKNKGLHKELIAGAVYDILRNWRYLWACRQEEPMSDPQALKTLVRTWEIIQNHEEPERQDHHLIWRSSGSLDAITLSVPSWLYELGLKEIGMKWRTELAAMNAPAKTVLRVNTLKISVTDLVKQMDRNDTGTVTWAPDALVLNDYQNVYTRQEYRRGLFEVQDAASQAVSILLQAEPGMRVVDACAGAGGKSLHLAALMQNKGRIISLDTSENKLAELRRRARRAGAFIIETRVITSSKSIKRLQDTADRLLLDVPCSGTGVLHRNPDLRWRLTSTMLNELMEKQKQILQQYCRILKKGGRMVYATCSLLPCEGEAQVAWFIEQNQSSFRMLEEKRYSSANDGFDGFYVAVLERTLNI
jgi:16S rRNA (cytosine967-C5)-methyltransferase